MDKILNDHDWFLHFSLSCARYVQWYIVEYRGLYHFISVTFESKIFHPVFFA